MTFRVKSNKKQQEKTRLTKEKIIAAAITEFGTMGYEKANINNISSSGIAKGLIYHNFSGKDDLYIECLKSCFEEVTSALACPENIGDYSVYFDRRITLFKEKPTLAAMVLEALINPPKHHIEIISEIRKGYDKMNAGWMAKILEQSELRKNVTMETALQYLSLMQDMFNWYCTSPKFKENAFENMVELHEERLPEIFEYMLRGVVKGD